MIKIKTYNISNGITLNIKILNIYIIKFWKDVFEPAIQQGDNKHLMILCKIKYNDDINSAGYKTLGPLRRVEFSDKELFTEYLQERLELLIESYEPLNCTEIIFTYVIKEGKISDKDRSLLKDFNDKPLQFHNFNKIKLPISMFPEDYGTIRGIDTSNSEFTRFFVVSDNKTFQIDKYTDKMMNKIKMLGAIDLIWTDSFVYIDTTIKREIDKTTIYFLDGEIILHKRELPAKSFRRLRSR
jgi:hypothetical protein